MINREGLMRRVLFLYNGEKLPSNENNNIYNLN